MISYEFAKELKDAGFPQSFRAGSLFFLNGEAITYPVTTAPPSLSEDSAAKIPTLSELISACDFESLYAPQGSVTHWRANGFNHEGLRTSSFGETSDEAVANLYLALNKK